MCVFIISACKQHNSLCTVLIVANICDLYTFIYKAASAAAACTVYEMAQDRQLLARYCLWFLSQEIVCLLLLSCLFTACFTNCVSLLHGSLTTLFCLFRSKFVGVSPISCVTDFLNTVK